MGRPVRTRIVNEMGNLQTLPEDKGQFEIIPGGPKSLFLGLGPQPELLADYFPEHIQARFIEHTSMIDQIDHWEDRLPKSLNQMSAEEFTTAIAAKHTIIRYRPGLKAFPGFWGPLTARTVIARIPDRPCGRVVWLPFGERDLLGRELALAFEEKGYIVRQLDHEKLERSAGTEIPALLEEKQPELFFSINFKGLDPFGLGFNLLREAGVKVAVWLVDNPFNILTSVKSAYWKEVNLFVTDHTFIQPLITTGARKVVHLPLAASPHFFVNGGTLPDHAHDLAGRLVFVGRSEFPKKNKFFAGMAPNQSLLNEAIPMLDKGERPHFHWWQERILSTLWPGNEVRHVACGAEAAGHAWRVRSLSAAGPNCIIFGDDQWARMASVKAEIRPLLDYYAHLPAVYRAASVSMNITGMQLPAGLTQRHFDVWCAGGFLITDNNPGLQIFPETLTGPITFKTATDIPSLFAHFRDESEQKEKLRASWQEHILTEHTYSTRVATLLKMLNMPETVDAPIK